MIDELPMKSALEMNLSYTLLCPLNNKPVNIQTLIFI